MSYGDEQTLDHQHIIMKTKTFVLYSVLFSIYTLLSSCITRYDRAEFDPVRDKSYARTGVPNTHIDTNDTSGWNGFIKSTKPYDIWVLYPNAHPETAAHMESVVLTKFTVTYADGTVDPGTKALKLPMRIKTFVYEGSDRNPDGSINHSKDRRIEKEMIGVVSRDEPFTLQIEGRFIKYNGTSIPFTIKQKYNMKWDRRIDIITLFDIIANI